MTRALLTCVTVWALAAGAQPVGAPKLPPAKPWTPPAAKVVSLASGAKAWVHPRAGLPLVQVVVSVGAGSLMDPPERSGLAALTATALEEGGAGDQSPAQVLAAFDALGTQLHVGATDEVTLLSLTVLSANLEPALRELALVLTQPRFDAAAFASVKQRRLSQIVAQADEPRALAMETLLHQLYGAGPRGHGPLGDAKAVTATTLDDVKGFYQARFGPSAVTFIVVGDVTEASAKQLLDQAFPSPWLKASPSAPVVEPAPAKPTWVGIDKPDAQQTVLLLGRPAFGASDPRVSPTELAATILGGSFTSRLVQNLREKHGYTYGATAHLDAGAQAGTLLVATAVKSQVTADALEQLLLELRGLGNVTPEEHAKARALLDTSVVDQFSASTNVAFLLADGVAARLGPDFLAKDFADRAKATRVQLIEATRLFDPDGYTLVIVGDQARIEGALKQKFPQQSITWLPKPVP